MDKNEADKKPKYDKPLTAKNCQNALIWHKPYRIPDGKGLFLLVKPNGKKYWRMKYKYGKNEKLLAIGVYPETSLAQARKACLDARELIKQGIDPTQTKRALKAQNQEKSENTFKAMFDGWYENKKDGWSPRYAKILRERMERDVLPALGYRPIADIRTPEIIACLRKIESRGAGDITKRCNQNIGKVFDYAIAMGKIDINPAHSTRILLKPVKTKHQKCMPTKDVPEFLHALANNTGNLQPQTINAMRFLMLTFVRTKEMNEATWDEIDFDKNEWRIDKTRMKMNRDHIVPLSTQVKEILYAQLKMIDDLGLKTNWVFPSLEKPKKPISNGTILGALRRMKFNDRHTGHGFRSLARTMIHENLTYRPEAIERQLSHKSNERLGEAYDRTQFLDERKKMMQDWANYIDALASQGKVIRGKFGG